jgi:hypothetical protein
MVSSKFYSVEETMLKLYVEEEAAKVCTSLAMTILVP